MHLSRMNLQVPIIARWGLKYKVCNEKDCLFMDYRDLSTFGNLAIV
jgi:hypothetical protein